ncbi:MAG TPA: cytochrome c [Ignavibacteria bacterium]|nr:cytochrome c [Ignavibacteria bacterium]
MKLKRKYITGFLLVLGFFVVVAISGCASTTDIADRSGAELWGNNCASCHNIRPPQTLTDAQWEVAGIHMRTRANLTGVETNKIIEFLKTAN